VFPFVVDEAVDVAESLGMRFAEIAAARFVIGDGTTGPEEIDKARVAFEVLTGSSKLAMARRDLPNTAKNSFQKV
jgi:hypothetical protein